MICAIPRNPSSMDFDVKRNRAVIVVSTGLFVVDLDSGESEYLVGESSEFNPYGVVLDDKNSTLYVTDDYNHSIHKVDPVSGNHSVIADESLGSGPLLDNMLNIAVDSATGRLYLPQNDQILEIDIATGNRKVMSERINFQGPYLPSHGWIYFDDTSRRLIASASGGIASIDLQTGYRQTMQFGSVNTTYSSAAFDLDPANGRIFGTGSQLELGFGILDMLSGQVANIAF